MSRAGRRRGVVEPLGDLAHLRIACRADRHEMGLVGSDLGRPDDALLVVVGFDDAGHVPPQTDPVRAHDDRVGLAVLAEIGRPHRRGVLGPELEDVADLDPPPQFDRRAAADAEIAFASAGDLGDDVRGVVARDVDVLHVPADPVRPRDQVWRTHDQVVDDDDRVAGSDR